MIPSNEAQKASDLTAALTQAKEILTEERFGYVDCALEASVLTSLEGLLEELAVQMFARDDVRGALALKEGAAAARRLSTFAEETGRADTECTCQHGEQHHTTHGCWANVPATFSEGVTDCPCLHRNSFPRTESRPYAESELQKKWTAAS